MDGDIYPGSSATTTNITVNEDNMVQEAREMARSQLLWAGCVGCNEEQARH